jgi:hypothetical protein
LRCPPGIALAIFYSQDITITGKEIVAETSFCWWRWTPGAEGAGTGYMDRDHR